MKCIGCFTLKYSGVEDCDDMQPFCRKDEAKYVFSSMTVARNYLDAIIYVAEEVFRVTNDDEDTFTVRKKWDSAKRVCDITIVNSDELVLCEVSFVIEPLKENELELVHSVS